MRPVHFEIHAADVDRAIKFYSSVFGWKFTKWDGPMPYWMIETGPDNTPGINGGLMARQGPPPVDGAACNCYPCTIGVDNIDGMTEKATKAGGVVVVPKMEIPGVGHLIYIKDTEGNILGMMQFMAAHK